MKRVQYNLRTDLNPVIEDITDLKGTGRFLIMAGHYLEHSFKAPIKSLIKGRT